MKEILILDGDEIIPMIEVSYSASYNIKGKDKVLMSYSATYEGRTSMGKRFILNIDY